MLIIVLIIVLALICGGGGGYYGYNRWGTGGGAGIGPGKVLPILLVCYLLGLFWRHHLQQLRPAELTLNAW